MTLAFDEFLAELTALPEAEEKLKFLLALAEDLPPLPEAEKTPENKISGCASDAYLVAEYRNGKMFFRGDADAQIPKGILSLLILGFEENTPEEVLRFSSEALEHAGLINILSPSRANGAYQIFARMQEEARKYL